MPANFSVLKQSKKSRARLGILKTSHGEVETPSLVPVATQAAVKTLTSEQAQLANCQLLIANTFHLHLKPGETVVKKAGGLHKFMNWRRPLMTDSGGFQVFSLGFGRDLQVGKVLKFFPGEGKDAARVHEGAQPKSVRITSEGVEFTSPLDGKKLFIGPRESIAIQEKLGADIMFAFDECTPPLSTREYVESALRRTHRWAKICVEVKRTPSTSLPRQGSGQVRAAGPQALFGIVQGSRYKDLREKSAKFIHSLGFDGFGIGGDLGHSKKTTHDIISWVLPHLDVRKPRHLLGIGKLEDIEAVVKSGIDTFDCTVPTHYARRGIAFTRGGALDLGKAVFLRDKKPLDPTCGCPTCAGYRRNYIAHLIRAKESTAGTLLTMHNLYFFNSYITSVREKIKHGKL